MKEWTCCDKCLVFTLLPSGSTIGSCSNAACECHTTPTHQNEAEWADGFEKLFSVAHLTDGRLGILSDPKTVKDYIRANYISRAQIAEVVAYIDANAHKVERMDRYVLDEIKAKLINPNKHD